MPTKYTGTLREMQVLNMFITLARASNTIFADVNRALAAPKLSPSQFGALETLFHLGPMNQRELGTKLLKTNGNMTMVVDNLERRGLVTRKRSSSDRRCITVSLTAAGRRVIKKAFPEVLRELVAGTDHLDDAELETLYQLCRKLGRREAPIVSDTA